MTEAEWLACEDPRAMDEHVYLLQTGQSGGLLGELRRSQCGVVVARKWRLLCCAFCRRFSGRTNWVELQSDLELTEQCETPTALSSAERQAATYVTGTAYAIFASLEETFPAASSWTEAEVIEAEQD